MKKAAPKTSKKVKRTSPASSQAAKPHKRSLIESYYRQTDEFFYNHPHSRVLLGLFIVVFAIFLGLFFHDKAQAMGWKNEFYYHYYY